MKRLTSIDALRGSAALAVLLCHAFKPTVYAVAVTSPVWYAALSPILYGFAGVNLFLVLSGFCIHLPMAAKSGPDQRIRLDVRRYTARRFWRLYPAYFAAMIFSAVVAVLTAVWLSNDYSATSWVERASDQSGQFVSHALLAHLFDIHHAWGLGNAAFWSLALEAELYLLYPLVLLMRNRWGIGRMLLCVLLVTMFSRWLGLWWWAQMDWGGITQGTVNVYVLLHAPMRWFEWCLGVVAAEAWLGRVRLPRMARSWLTGVAIFCVAAAGYENVVGLYLVDPLWGIAFFMILNGCVTREKQGGAVAWPWRTVAAIGVISYSLYLTHCPMVRVTKLLLYNFGIGFSMSVVSYTAMCLVCILGAAVFYRLCERPFLHRGRTPKPPVATLPMWKPELERKAA